MKEYKLVIATIIVCISAIICVSIGMNGFVSYKEKANSGGIVATGSASRDFESDLIVWRGSFSAYGHTTADAYNEIKRNSRLIKDYLSQNGVAEEEMIFYSINISQQYAYEYNENGDLIAERPDGYNLTQALSVTSSDVNKVEEISRDITQLIESGVEFFSESPEYYYTKLDELKLEMIGAATANAKERIDIMASGSGSRAGKLLNANLGVFQITAQNSSSEDYSYGGAFNTGSKSKTASITVKLNYAVD